MTKYFSHDNNCITSKDWLYEVLDTETTNAQFDNFLSWKNEDWTNREITTDFLKDLETALPFPPYISAINGEVLRATR